MNCHKSGTAKRVLSVPVAGWSMRAVLSNALPVEKYDLGKVGRVYLGSKSWMGGRISLNTYLNLQNQTTGIQKN